jgi:hypothetical protein
MSAYGWCFSPHERVQIRPHESRTADDGSARREGEDSGTATAISIWWRFVRRRQALDERWLSSK